MGNKSQKKTNQLLGNQTNLINQNAAANNARSGSEYDYRTSTRDYLTNSYKNLANGLDINGNPIAASGGGGGGGGGEAAWVDPATGMRQSVYDQYKNLADTGGWTPDEMTNYRSWTTAPIAGFYTGLKNDLQRRNNAIGGFAGYNSQSAKMARDAARQGFQTAQESESGLQQMIRDAKLQGIQGMESTANDISAASRPRGGGGGGGGGGGAGSSEQDYYLRQLQGLMGGSEDLPYAQLGNQGLGMGTQSIAARVDETPAWQKMATSLIPSAANAALGAFGRPSAPRQSSGGSNFGFF